MKVKKLSKVLAREEVLLADSGAGQFERGERDII